MRAGGRVRLLRAPLVMGRVLVSIGGWLLFLGAATVTSYWPDTNTRVRLPGWWN